MKNVIIIFAKRPVTVIMIIAAICIAAIFSFNALPLDRLPELSVPRVMVETVYPGMSAEDIRSLVTIPVEDAFSSVKGVESIRSVSRDGSSLVTLDFRWGTDPMAASALVREAVDAVYPTLPHGVRKPSVSAGNPDTQPHSIIAVRSLIGDESFARRLADYELRSRLRRIDGAGSVLLAGGEVNEGRLRLDVPRLAALGLSPPEFANLFSGEVIDIPAGSAREGETELVVVSSGRPNGIEDMAQLVLSSSFGPLYISDVGKLTLEAGRKKSIFVFNGKEAAALEIYRRPGADPVRLSRDINKAVKEANAMFSHNAEITLVKDDAPSLIRNMTRLAISAALGAAAVVAVLMLFIRNIRTGLLAALSIPLSVAAGICVLALTGRSLNSMSLGGLALGIGLVSDVAVIMLDLLHRNFGKRSGKPSAEETGEKAISIAGSSVSSTLTTIIVFVPIIFLPGPLGSLFGDTAIALVASVFTGWIYAQFFIPSLFRFTFRHEPAQIMQRFKGTNAFGLMKKYRKALAPVIRRPKKWFVIAAAASVVGTLFLFIRPAVFVSPGEAEEILVSVEFPPGTVMENIETYGAYLSGFLKDLPFIRTVYGRAGAEEEDVNRRADMDYRKEMLVIRCTAEKGVKPEKTVAIIRDAIDEWSGPDSEHLQTISLLADISVSLPKDKTEILLGLSSMAVYAVTGKDRGEWQERAGIIEKRLNEKISTGMIQRRPGGIRPELRLYPDREMLAFLGISAADIAESLYVMHEGVIAVNLEIDGKPLDVRVSGNPDFWNQHSASVKSANINILENSLIKTAQGKTVFLGSLGRIERRESDAVLARLDRADVVYFDIPLDKPLAETAKNLDNMFLWFFKAGESVFSRYRNALLLTLCLALVLIYMAMGAQFESFLLPPALMLAIPLSLAGAGPALALFNSRLDSGAVMGICALFGLAVNNGLILFEISEQRLQSGCRPAAAVYGGASIRLRPILITTLTAVIALLPIALNPLGGAQKTMAVSMLGGLAASSLLSLFILPPVFIRFFSWRKRYG